MSTIEMKTTSILSVPLESYVKDFSFIVNGEEIKTSRLVSDLLSPTICKIHLEDPTIEKFVINTNHCGDFKNIIKLANFNEISISDDELEFIIEVLEILGNESITIHESGKDEESLSNDNIFEKLKKHEKFKILYSDRLFREIEYISSHFFELYETHKEELVSLEIDTLFRILKNENLKIQTEDELIDFINELYRKSSSYSILYEAVEFANLSTEKVDEFIEIYDYNAMTKDTWQKISNRLKQETSKIELSKRYAMKETKFVPNKNNPFSGIINYLHTQSKNSIENEINITVSSCGTSSTNKQPSIVISNENKPRYYYSNNTPNSWLCLDFKEHKIIPTDYTIRSGDQSKNGAHMKNWIIEGSLSNNEWDKLDEETNCPHLNDTNAIHTFHIDQQKANLKEYRYFRIRETGKNWQNDDYLSFNRIEIFGTLI